MNANEEVRPEKKFPIGPIAIVSLIMISEPISMSVLYPFIYYMVRDFKIVDDENIGLFSGILSAAFSIAQFFSGTFWGNKSDKHGRRNVLIIGLVVNSLATLLFGLSTSFKFALISRLMSGLFNGNQGVCKSVLADVTDINNR
jgi:MFS family permease